MSRAGCLGGRAEPLWQLCAAGMGAVQSCICGTCICACRACDPLPSAPCLATLLHQTHPPLPHFEPLSAPLLLPRSITKVLPGRFLLLGTQGPKRSGLVQAPPGLPESNPDLLSSAAFRLPHRRPGTVSLNLSGERRRAACCACCEAKRSMLCLLRCPGIGSVAGWCCRCGTRPCASLGAHL